MLCQSSGEIDMALLDFYFDQGTGIDIMNPSGLNSFELMSVAASSGAAQNDSLLYLHD
jgi:hypothetical protein